MSTAYDIEIEINAKNVREVIGELRLLQLKDLDHSALMSPESCLRSDVHERAEMLLDAFRIRLEAGGDPNEEEETKIREEGIAWQRFLVAHRAADDLDGRASTVVREALLTFGPEAAEQLVASYQAKA